MASLWVLLGGCPEANGCHTVFLFFTFEFLLCIIIVCVDAQASVMYVEIREQLLEVTVLLPSTIWSQGLNLGLQAWRRVL